MPGILVFIVIMNLLAYLLYRRRKPAGTPWLRGLIRTLTSLTVILGGSIGALAALQLSKPRQRREPEPPRKPAPGRGPGMMRRSERHEPSPQEQWRSKSLLYVVMWLIIHLLLCVLFLGPWADTVKIRIAAFLQSHLLLSVYLLLVNVAAFALYAWDKILAMTHRRRIPEKTLLLLALLGGSIGSLFAMDVCRHKITGHPQFMPGVPIILVLQILIAAAAVFLL